MMKKINNDSEVLFVLSEQTPGRGNWVIKDIQCPPRTPAKQMMRAIRGLSHALGIEDKVRSHSGSAVPSFGKPGVFSLNFDNQAFHLGVINTGNSDLFVPFPIMLNGAPVEVIAGLANRVVEDQYPDDSAVSPQAALLANGMVRVSIPAVPTDRDVMLA